MLVNPCSDYSGHISKGLLSALVLILGLGSTVGISQAQGRNGTAATELNSFEVITIQEFLESRSNMHRDSGIWTPATTLVAPRPVPSVARHHMEQLNRSYSSQEGLTYISPFPLARGDRAAASAPAPAAEEGPTYMGSKMPLSVQGLSGEKNQSFVDLEQVITSP